MNLITKRTYTIAHIWVWSLGLLYLLFLQRSHRIDDDEWEHLSAACEIAMGKIPYIDFFEHHIPSFWIMLAPFCNEVQTAHHLLYWRILMVVISCIGLIGLARLGGGGITSSIITLSFLGVSCYSEKLVEIRPDVPAFSALCWGLYLTCTKKEISHSTRLGVFLLGLSCSLQFKFYLLMALPLFIFYTLHGFKRTFSHLLYAITPTLLLFYWLINKQCLQSFWDYVIVLNSQWPESFPFWTWVLPSYQKFPTPIVLGTLCAFFLFFNFFSNFKKNITMRDLFHDIAPALFLILSIILIFIIPNPYPQSFLPLLLALSWSFARTVKHIRFNFSFNPFLFTFVILWLFPLAPFFNLSSRPQQTPLDQLKEWKKVITESNNKRISVLSFTKAHPGFISAMQPGWCYDSIVEALKIKDFEDKVKQAWHQSSIAIIDHKMSIMVPQACDYIKEHSLPLDEASKHIRIHGFKLDGSDFYEGELDLEIIHSGKYQIDITPEQILSIDQVEIKSGAFFNLKMGQHLIECDDFVDSISIRLIH